MRWWVAHDKGVFRALGEAIGGALGGTIWRVIGQAVERSIINSLTPARPSGRIAGLKLSGSAQADPMAQIVGRARVAGTVIWAARRKDHRDRTRASKTAPASETFGYALSFDIVLCDGPINGIGRIWVDGLMLDQSQLSYSLYSDDQAQLPDALIAVIEGSATAIRDIADMILEDFDVTPFGNRPLSISVEVICPSRRPHGDQESKARTCALSPAQANSFSRPRRWELLVMMRAMWETQHTGEGRTDFIVSLDQMAAALTNLKRVNVVVASSGTSTEIGDCLIRPRAPAATAELKTRGYAVTLGPLLLMDCEGFPWRRR